MSTILLVDDEPAFLRLAAAWLEKQGHHAVTAKDGAVARALFAQIRPDLVLLDLVMPPERSAEAGLALVPLFAAVPVIVMTAHGDHDLALRAVAAGAWDFLVKPVEPDLLRIVLGRALIKRDLERELTAVRAARRDDDGLIGASPAIQRLKEMIARIGPTDVPVIVLGPSGTGKELAARSLHRASGRNGGPFITIHCGAIPSELLESELFGHIKGSFTGAHQDRQGLLAAAHGGSLFLDEVGEMPLAMQVKLLRFLQEGVYTPVGGRTAMAADVRVIAATHRNLDAMIADGSFREDFYYRLKGLILRIPALAARREDIGILATRFAADTPGPVQRSLSPDALRWLVMQEWPGNIRELRAVVTAAAALAPGELITPSDLAFARTGDPMALSSEQATTTLAVAVAQLERRMISATLAATAQNHSAAARQLGLSRVGLLKMMKRLGLR